MSAVDGYLTCELCEHWGADVTTHRGIARCHVCKLVADQRRSDADVTAGRLLNVGVDRHGAAVYARAENVDDMLALGALERVGVQGDQTVYALTDVGRKSADIPMGEGDVLVLGVLESLTDHAAPALRQRAAQARRWFRKMSALDRHDVHTVALVLALADALERYADEVRVSAHQLPLLLLPVAFVLEATRDASTIVDADFDLNRWLRGRRRS